MTEHVDTVVEALERDGIAPLPALLPPASLTRLQEAFALALQRPSFNTWTGFEQTEKWRLVVENALAVDPTMVDVALHPLVLDAIRRYVGPTFTLAEARGWRTIESHKDFHGWHADAWYREGTRPRPREVKLGLYLSDVESGHFSYVAGSQGLAPSARHWSPREVAGLPGRQVHMKGPAGTAFLFDTAGVHRQSVPVLTPRQVVFLNFHDPDVDIQQLDVDWGRYRPLMLNAGMMPDLDDEQRRVLGFGRARSAPVGSAVPGRATNQRFPTLHRAAAAALRLRLEWAEAERFGRRLKRGAARITGRR